MSSAVNDKVEAPSSALPPSAHAQPRRRVGTGLIVGGIVVAVFAVLPLLDVHVPVLLSGRLSSSGSLLIIATGLVFAGVAMSFDVLYGYTGLFTAGHGLVFALGMYTTNMGMMRGLGYVPAALLGIVISTIVATLTGAVALRARGVAFTMVTLAFGEALFILLMTDPWDVFGGDEGLPLVFGQVPALLAGARDVRWLYWLALGFAVFTFLLAFIVTRSRAGAVWQALRENEDRVELLGLNPYRFKLLSYAFGSFLGAVGGAVYLLVIRGANPSVSEVHFSLSLVVMVVLGGAGRLWGAAIGGMLYGLLTLRLPAVGTSGVLDGLPDWLARVLSEPLLILGVVFTLVVLFVPGGVVGVVDRIRRNASRRRKHPKGAE
jgi:branched-chain amino acid transport system permease protein